MNADAINFFINEHTLPEEIKWLEEITHETFTFLCKEFGYPQMNASVADVTVFEPRELRGWQRGLYTLDQMRDIFNQAEEQLHSELVDDYGQPYDEDEDDQDREYVGGNWEVWF